MKAGIAQRELERAALAAKLEHTDGLAKAAAAWDSGSLVGTLKAAVADWNGLVEQSPEEARQVFKKILSRHRSNRGRARRDPSRQQSALHR